MKKIFSFFLIFCLFGCTFSQNQAINTANDVREIASEEHDLINKFCTNKYLDAKSQKDIDKIDKVCLPAYQVYGDTKDAWISLIAVINAFKYDGTTQQQINEAAQKLVKLMTDLQKLVEPMK